jgi:large repetitive protein
MTSVAHRFVCAAVAACVPAVSTLAQSPPPGLNPNLVLWLKADAGTSTTTDGAVVTSWSDQSGHGHVLTATPTGGPIFDADGNGSLPSLRFNGAQLIGTNLGRGFTDATIFVVARQTAPTSNDNYIYSLGSTGNGRMFTLARGTAANTPGHTESYHWNGSTEHLGDCIPFGMYNVFAQSYHGSVTGAPFHTLWIDGVNANMETANTAYNVTSGALRLGNYVSGSFYHEGDITEFMIYDRALTDAERQSVETYLTTRIHVAPRCPCDWNGCDGMNSQDFFDFLVDFFAADADFNHSGATDSQDFFDFLVCFFGGCA